MQKMKWITVLVVWLAAGNLLAQAGHQVIETKDAAPLDAQREKHAMQSLLNLAEKVIIPAVEAMPADKFGFAPTDGEFKGVRTFGQMVKHLSATNHILAAAALGEEPPSDAGDEMGPEAVRTKAEILNYLNGSFAHLSKAIEAIGQANVPVNPSPISPLKKGEVTRSALIVEALMHACDHYGQIVEYLRMNGVVPPQEQAMSDRFDKTPTVCSLTTVELRDRGATLLAQFRSAILETEELQEGYAFRLPGDGEWIRLTAELIVAERECCPFLTFEVLALPDNGPVIVRVIGPAGAKEFLRTVLYKPEGSS